MTLEDAYAAVKNRLDSIDFSVLWRGFHPFSFALYNADACFLDGAYVKKTDMFTANTAIEYNGRFVAIWNMEHAPDDLDVLAAKLAHEMFHAFQQESGESRWANETDALKNYRCSAENLSGKLKETELMRRIVRDGDGASFQHLLALRRLRAERFPYEYDYEARIEQIEGAAQYVELLALEQLSAEKAEKARQSIWEKLAEPERYMPVRMISYAIGAAFLSCIRTCSGYDAESFSAVPFSVGILAEASGAAPELKPDPRAETVVASYEAETRAIIGAALKKNRVVLRGRYPLVSLNIASARRDGRYAFSEFFVMYRDGDAIRTLDGDFVVELDESDNICAVYAQ